MKKVIYEILTGSTGVTHQIPIFLEDSVDEMGIMVGFDGDIEQVEQFCNFTYISSGNTITIYNSLNTNKLKTLIDSVFTISWGDGEPDTNLIMPTVYNQNLPYTTHTYAVDGTYDVEITVDSPWKVQKIKRKIVIPYPRESEEYNDWFLPSLSEMSTMLETLHTTAPPIGNFNADGYWTSTEVDGFPTTVNTFEKWQTIYLGYSRLKSNDTCSTRPCRSFISLVEYNERDIGPSGGYIFYKLSLDEELYYYLEAYKEDISSTQPWSDIIDEACGASGVAIGTGKDNTDLIIGQHGPSGNSAARLCTELSILITNNSFTFPTDFGVLTFTIPYSNPIITGVTQQYLEDYRTLTGDTSGATISFIAIGKSRIDEFKSYGSSSVYSGVTTGHTDAGDYTGYTIDGLFYMDYSDGYTHITGNTSNYYTDEVYQGMITRDEHLIGFMDAPQIFSDIFVERGKQGVMERNLRLGEIDSVGELDIYGSGFFKVKKQ